MMYEVTAFNGNDTFVNGTFPYEEMMPLLDQQISTDYNVSASGDGWWTEAFQNTLNGTVIAQMRSQFNDYFNYGVEMYDAPAEFDEPICSTNQECDQSGYMTKCCAKAVMWDPQS